MRDCSSYRVKSTEGHYNIVSILKDFLKCFAPIVASPDHISQVHKVRVLDSRIDCPSIGTILVLAINPTLAHRFWDPLLCPVCTNQFFQTVFDFLT